MNKVLITGGAGFIGQHLARRLVASGHTVTALDSLSGQVHLDPDSSTGAFPGEVIVADVADPAAWEIEALGIDRVVHLAAETGTGQSMYETDRYHRVNVDGTRLAAEFAARCGAALVSMSSRAVYGEGRHRCPDHAVTYGATCCDRATPQASTEDDPHAPVSVYGETKSLAEAAAREAASGVPLAIVRPQNVIGPGQALHNPYTGVLAAFLAMLREGRPLTIYGDGSQTRDLVHVSDLVALLTELVDDPPPVGRPLVLNSGSGTRTTLLELAAHAINGAGVPSPGVVHLDIHRAGDIDHACADLTRLRDAGLPEPAWSTADAVGDFVRWAWERPGASSSAWDSALAELQDRGLTS